MSSRNDPDSQRSLPAGDPDAIAEGGRHFAAGRYAESLAIVDAALARTPAVPELLFARGSALFGWGRHHEALASFRRAADAGLVHFDLDMQLGWCCVHVQKLDEAEVHFRKAVATEPESDSAYVALANVLEMRGMLAAQAGEFARGLSRWPDNYDAVILHAACKLYRNERDAGVAMFRQAIANDPSRSRAWSNLGATLDWATQLPEALAALQRAVEIDSENARPGDGFLNLATLLRERGRRAEALHLLERNLLRNPDPKGHWLYSVMLLETGHLAEGWEQHEFRWLKEPLLSRRWSMRCPIWQGQDVCGKTVLLHAEQGFGDAIQFIRYARRLKDLGARVVFDTFKGFDEISRDFDSVDDVLVDGAVPPHFDYRIPLLSLPRVFGTDLASIPATVPYVKVRPAYLDTWTQRIPAAGELKVGLVWAGNPKHQRDRQRSIPLSTLAPLFGVEGVRFHSLQK
ncbi:MAG TPA: tetratricopeptide repeat protein, partial [Casimicrobiaceae bacterium]|nr:tetratricopeptide repeat protein [Casimicrobiaceae bacterium]